MLYRINYVTRSRQTIEAESLSEAEVVMRKNIDEANSHCHHGEEVAASLEFHYNGVWYHVTRD